MGGTFVFERFDLLGDRTPAADGEFVSAQEALDREAILQAEIRTLETQLKDARTALAGAAAIANASGAPIAALRERIAGMEKDAGWISVEDRLPKNDQIVAFVVKADRESPNWYLNGHVLGGTYHESWGFSTPGVGHRASHWMPLPEAPASSVASKEGGV